MPDTRIRHLAASRGALVAAARFENTVSVWNVQSGLKQAEFRTILDFGGKRLVIDSDGQRCVAAAYHLQGIACYSAIDGTKLWHRRELKKAHILTLSPDGKHVFCGFDSRPCAVLDINTGQEVAKLRGVRAVYESPFEAVRLLDQDDPELQTTAGEPIGRVERETFAFLAAAFGPGRLCTSESGGSVRCFDTASAQELWRYTPGSGRHVLAVGHSPRWGSFVGVEWPYVFRGPKVLKRFDAGTGDVQAVCELGQPATTTLCLGDRFLLTSDGQLFDVTTGEVVRTLSFGGDEIEPGTV